MAHHGSRLPNFRVIDRSLTPVRGGNRKILQIFWIVAFSLCSWVLFFSTSELPSIGGALAIIIAALYPTYLWCSQKALGTAIFPLFAIPFIWAYALPLIGNAPGMALYTPENRFFAGLTTAGFLLLATFIWLQFVQSPPTPPPFYRQLADKNGTKLLLIALTIGTLFSLNNSSKWFDIGLFYSTIQAGILALNALAIFILSHRLGTYELNKKQRQSFLLLLTLLVISDTTGLLLVSAISVLVVALIGFAIGRKKVSLRLLFIMAMCFALLHYGKAEMRVKYGIGNQAVQFWEYPAWYAEWAGYSIDYLVSKSPNSSSGKVAEKQSLAERSSVIQLLLLTQTNSPQSIPYLNGVTYAIIPQLLIPRILNSSKIASHEGTYLLNIHYGQQTRQDTRTTTIGWGLLAESYANFGLFGCGGLAIVLGTLYGLTTRWSINAPLLSDRSLLSIVMISYAFQSEFSAGVYVAALFQSSTIVLIISIFLMRSIPSGYNPLLGSPK